MRRRGTRARSASPMRNCSTRARGFSEAARQTPSMHRGPPRGERKPDRRRAFLRSGSHAGRPHPPDRPGRKGGHPRPRRLQALPATQPGRTTSTPPAPTRPAKSSAGSRTCSAQSSRSPSATPGSPSYADANRTVQEREQRRIQEAERAAQAETDARRGGADRARVLRPVARLADAGAGMAGGRERPCGQTRRNSGSCGMAAPAPLTSTAI